MPTSPVQEVKFSQALNITLDNYYDLLKLQIGGLATEEYLQLKLVADTVDISAKDADAGGYRWWSYYNLLKRSDTAIEPEPISGQVFAAVKRLNEVYEAFLGKLQGYVVVKNLSQAEQDRIGEIEVDNRRLKMEANALVLEDRKNWAEYAEALGYDVGDEAAYVQWSSAFGNSDLVQQRLDRIDRNTFEKLNILDRQYPEPDDRKIVDGVVDFERAAMRLRYPFHPDYEYDKGNEFSLEYLSRLPPGSTALFDDRRALGWSVTLTEMKTGVMGAFDTTLDNSSNESESISTDWKTSASARYGFIKVSASASEHISIQEDFDKATSITLSAESAFRANINYPAWFNPSLFENKRVKENISDFAEFFAEKGTLRYYPTALLLIRGFSVEFTSSQNWTYDFERKFNASAGGGFNAFGVKFGGNGSYSKHEEKHKVDKSATSLKFFDGDEVLRFVGYAVKQNTIYDETVDIQSSDALGAARI